MKPKPKLPPHDLTIHTLEPGDPDCDHIYQIGTGRRDTDGREIFQCQECSAQFTYPPYIPMSFTSGGCWK